ncbi:MAG TPA: malate synthase A, partial [Xanthomonadales bacterium]|nr:malate synthase A [Xanthomonadales bacterium]
MSQFNHTAPHLTVTGQTAGQTEILTAEAMAFLAALVDQFTAAKNLLLAQRNERQARINQGEKPDFPAETREQREREWKVAGLPQEALDRRTEITGPVSRKMVINALNSG